MHLQPTPESGRAFVMRGITGPWGLALTVGGLLCALLWTLRPRPPAPLPAASPASSHAPLAPQAAAGTPPLPRGERPADPAVVPASPAPDGSPLSSGQHLHHGQAALRIGDLEAAQEHFQAVIEAHPDGAMAAFALYELAWVEAGLGDRQAAIADLRLLLQWLDGADDRASRLLATEAAEALDRFEAAPEGPVTPAGAGARSP